jgi:penicillin-binding protein 1A
MRHPTLLALVGLLAAACGPVVRFDVSDPADFVQQPQTGEVVDIDGAVLAELHAEQDRRDVTLDDVADVLEQAVVAIEDRRFLLHHGVDVASIARAAVRNIEEGQITEGGSTITQQYVKNTITGPAVTLERKVQEAVAAWQLEDRYSKEEILERYLNTVYFGKGAYGVRAAALRFFGTEPAELTLPQAALLAGMIASPSGYDPYDNPEPSRARRARVLDAMVDFGVISRSEADEADAAPLGVKPIAPDRFAAPYVVEEAKRIIREDPDGTFAAALGADPDDRVEALFTDGLRVVTTVDLDVQRRVEAAVAAQLPAEGPSAAVVVTDPQSGAVRALVGGRDFYDEDDPTARFNLATQGRRQPGSSFKPVVLALALERGTKLEEVFPGGSCAAFPDLREPWAPCNYGNTDYPPMSIREATVRSVNTVYARLGVRLGSTSMLEMATTLGFTGLPQVPSLALGTGEVTVWQMAGAYGAFANLGRYSQPYLIDRIETAGGEVLYRHDPSATRPSSRRPPTWSPRPCARSSAAAPASGPTSGVPRPARPGPRRTARMPGSSATRPTSSLRSGSASRRSACR